MIKIETIVNSNIEKVWDSWNKPEHIEKWAFASDDWQATNAENDLKVGGEFKTRMSAKEGSVGFDFGGKYTAVDDSKLIEYMMADGRKVRVQFIETPNGVHIIEEFDPESQNPEDFQRAGWQAILDNFKKYTEELH